MDPLRKCRRKHLRPLCDMKPGDLILHIENLNLSQIRALIRAMKSCTTTNCGWVEYDIANRYMRDAELILILREKRRAKRAKAAA